MRKLRRALRAGAMMASKVQSKLKVMIAGLVLAVLSGTGGDRVLASAAEAARVGFTAPDFQLQDMNDNTVRLAQFRGSHPVFLNFWASWCPACRLEARENQKLYRLLGSRGLRFVAVSIDRGPGSPANVRAFVKEFGLPFSPLWDSDGTVAELYRVTAIPTTFLIDRNGKIVAREIGPKHWTEPERMKFFETLIDQQLN